MIELIAVTWYSILNKKFNFLNLNKLSDTCAFYLIALIVEIFIPNTPEWPELIK